jgi:hypothetical protein
MLKTVEGKWVLFTVPAGEQVEHWPVDAKILLKNGTHSLEPPEGIEVHVPPAPPQYVGVPKAPVATIFEAPGTAEPAKRGKKE